MDVTSTMRLNEDVANNNGYPDIETATRKTSQERKPRNMDAECCQFLNYGRSFCAQALPEILSQNYAGDS